MDPISSAMEKFREDFQEFRDNSELRILRVISESKNAASIGKILRAEEWDLDNQRPFLVFHVACTKESETFEPMCRMVFEHYQLLKQGFEENKKTIPNFGLTLADTEHYELDTLVQYILQFRKNIGDVLEPPYICWLPTDVKSEKEYIKSILRLLKLSPDLGLRFVLMDDPKAERLAQLQEALRDSMISASFEIDESALQDYLNKMMAPPSKGRVPGTMPGAAAPDVEPPPRPGPPPPNKEEIEVASKELKLPPTLTPEQGDRLQQLILKAAKASGEQDEKTTIGSQQQACKLCADAGVKLEQALMTLVLASYLLQFQRDEEAEIQYKFADKLAGDVGAYPQMAQARLALSHLLLKNKKIDEAAHVYEQAAVASIIGQVNLLYFESLRMAGSCHMQLGRKRQAYLCWNAAAKRVEKASPDEIRNSGFLDIAGELIRLLDEHGYTENARAVERLVVEAGKRSQLSVA